MVIYHGTIRRKSPSLSILNPSKLVILRTHAPLRHTSSKPFQQWRVPTHPLRLKQIQVDGGFSNDVKVIRYPYNGSFWYDQPQIYIYIYILYGHFSYWDFGKPPPKPATTIQPPWPKQRCFKEVSTCESSLTISRRRELCRKCHSSWAKDKLCVRIFNGYTSWNSKTTWDVYMGVSQTDILSEPWKKTGLTFH